ISREGDILDMGSDLNIVEKSGAWYSYKGERIGQGRENVKAYLKEHPEMASDIEGRILDHYGLTKKAKPEAKAETKTEKKSK
ncbi:MAG: DNA recombination/repair protein RecA, partial [Deltaproteobacteria bacterium]